MDLEDLDWKAQAVVVRSREERKQKIQANSICTKYEQKTVQEEKVDSVNVCKSRSYYVLGVGEAR